MEIIPFLFFLLVLFGMIWLVVSFILRGVQIVPEGTVAVVERQGRFLRVLDPGRHLLLPVDRIRQLVPLQEFDETLHADRVIMRNAVVIGLDMYIQYRVAHYQPQMVSQDQARRMTPEAVITWSRGRVRQRDVYSAVYNVDDWQEKTRKEALAVMQDALAMVDLAKDIFGTQVNALKQISAIVKRQLNERTLQYGVEVTDVNLFNPVVDDGTREFITSVKRAELQSRIQQIEAEAQVRIQQLEAENQARIQKTLGLSKEELLRWNRIEALKQISKNNPAARIYLGAEEMARMEAHDTEEPDPTVLRAEDARRQEPVPSSNRATPGRNSYFDADIS
jgi:regulator of protease activity HflC (stomatin/prohibitin superfamily)